jgi:hypothetical protein
VLLAVLGTLALAVAGCGSEEHPNDPKIPDPIETTVRIDDDGRVTVSPDNFGAGLVVFQISNQSNADAQFSLEGPVTAETNPIPAGGTSEVKVDLQPGAYQVAATGVGLKAKSSTLFVGPERESAKDELLLP